MQVCIENASFIFKKFKKKLNCVPLEANLVYISPCVPWLSGELSSLSVVLNSWHEVTAHGHTETYSLNCPPKVHGFDVLNEVHSVDNTLLITQITLNRVHGVSIHRAGDHNQG